MKLTKLIIAISELWNEKQLSSSKNCILRGIEEINKKVPITDLIDHLKNNDINRESCEVEVLINVTKVSLIGAIKNNSNFESLLLLYVGPVSVPWGQWLLCDGIISATDLLQTISNEHLKLVIATLAPCDDWSAAEKKHGDIMNVCSYDLVDCSDQTILGLSNYADSICNKLSITPCSIKRPDSMSFLKAGEPSVCGFFDKSSSAMPCLVLIDGFTMLFNVGYGRNPEMRHQLKYIAQVDSALLSHVSCNNILALSGSAQDNDSVKINHLFLPYGVSLHDKVNDDSENPFLVDLNNEVAKVLCGYSDRGTSVSNLSIKGKSGSIVTTNQVKPIQLYHKIGYGSLELIPLAPFDEDMDVKKFSEDLKKGKYVNEGHIRPLPSSLSVLLIWRPFNPKVAIKRFLYIGPRSQLRKNLPSVVTALYNNNECLRQADLLSGDGPNKKAASRKSPAVATGTGKTAPKVNGTMIPVPSNADKPPRPATASEVTKKHTAAQSALSSDKPTPRPATANVAMAIQKPKDVQATKRPLSKTDATKVHDTKKVEPVKVHDPKKTEPVKTHDLKKTEPKKTDTTKAQESKKIEPVKTHDSKKIEQIKVNDSKKTDTGKIPNSKKTESSIGHDPKKIAQKIPNKTDNKLTTVKHSVTKVDHSTEEQHDKEALAVINGDHEHSKEGTTVVTTDGDVLPDTGKSVVVGTVECAITEHGEADFCDDTPEEYSAQQMKELGHYAEDDEDRSSAPLSDGNDLAASGVCTMDTDMSHLPMDGSIYDHDVSGDDRQADTSGHIWNEPLGLPMPTRDSVAGAKKTVGKCATPIHVDCVCVPSDLDKEDLRCLFNCVRFRTGFVQLDKCDDLFRVLDLLMEEWSTSDGGDGSGCAVTTVLPSLDDEATVAWLHDNEARLSSANIKVAPALCRCSILIGGERGDDECLGFRCDL